MKDDPRFTIFIDTNFLFSILGLDDSQANDSATALLDLLGRLPSTVTLKLYVSKPTMNEALRVVEAYQDSLRAVRLPQNVASAVGSGQLGGIAMKFVEECRKAERALSADKYFGPYLSGMTAILREKGIELYNDNLEQYRSQGEVVEDVAGRLEFEKRRYGGQAKRYEAPLHDITLWHFASQQRGERVESPIEANYWVATMDFRLLGFDAFKRRARGGIPVCLHPTELVQMLQFWVPRTPEFEEAVVAGFRYSFLFSDFDASTERSTIRILEALATFENVEQLSEGTIVRFLVDRAVRQKLASEKDVEKRAEMVREVVIEENRRAREELAQAGRERERLGAEMSERARERGRLEGQLRERELELREVRGQVKDGGEARRGLEARLSELEEAKRESEEAIRVERVRRRFGWQCVGSAALTLLLCGMLAWATGMVTRSAGLGRREYWSALCAVIVVIGVLWLWKVEKVGSRVPEVRTWEPFTRLQGIRGRFGGFVWATVVGAVGNAAWEWIKGLRQ